MTTSFALLGILNAGPNYGYDLKQSYDAFFGKEKSLSFGQVYATLNRLLRDKKIRLETTEQAAGPERKKYAITAHGKQELLSWLQTPEQFHPESKTILFTKVVTAILLDEKPNEFLDTQRAAHLSRMRALTEVRRTGQLGEALRADYALFHLEADLRWIELTTARLDALTKEIRNE